MNWGEVNEGGEINEEGRGLVFLNRCPKCSSVLDEQGLDLGQTSQDVQQNQLLLLRTQAEQWCCTRPSARRLAKWNDRLDGLCPAHLRVTPMQECQVSSKGAKGGVVGRGTCSTPPLAPFHSDRVRMHFLGRVYKSTPRLKSWVQELEGNARGR